MMMRSIPNRFNQQRQTPKILTPTNKSSKKSSPNKSTTSMSGGNKGRLSDFSSSSSPSRQSTSSLSLVPASKDAAARCDCVLCMRRKPTTWSLDSSKFLSSLKSMKPSVNLKPETEPSIKNSFVELIYDIHDDVEIPRVKLATPPPIRRRHYRGSGGKVKLWNPDDVYEFMSVHDDDLTRRGATPPDQSNLSKQRATAAAINRLNENDLNNRISLIRLLKDRQLNPSLSPLLKTIDAVDYSSTNTMLMNEPSSTKYKTSIEIIVPPTSPLLEI